MRNTRIILTISLCLFYFLGLSQNSTPYFLTEPSLSPDASQVVFVYENDLWTVNTEGGTASRLTGMDGSESAPRFSPDGNWLAFSSNQFGNNDVYLMPVNGGDVIQLTFNSSDDKVSGWSWDSKSIYFTSSRNNSSSTYKVNINGDTPKQLFGDNYFNNVHNLVESPTEEAFYFNESWESSIFTFRKRYKGDHNPEIKYYNESTNTYKELTSYEGKDLWPSVDKNGKLYFASDEVNTVYNLFTIENNEKKQLTDYKTAIINPQVSANGQKVVFTNNYQLAIYDIATNTTIKPEINIFKNETLLTNQSFNISGKISNFDVSPDNKKLAFVSRGRLFVSDIKGKFIKEINTNNQERVIEVKWQKDNKKLIYTRTNKGWTNIFAIDASKNSTEIQLTKTDKTERNIELSPDKSKVVYISGTTNIDLLNLKTLAIENIIEDEFWFRGSQPKFSPDGKYIVYTAFRNFESDVFVYDIDKKTSINITSTGVPEFDPYWSPDGKYIYISAERYSPSYPRGKGTMRLYRIPLYKFAKDFKSDEYNDLFVKKPKKDSSINIKFDLDNIYQRWENVVNTDGELEFPHIFKSKKKQILFFYSYSRSGKVVTYKTEIIPFEKKKTKQISEKPFDVIVKAKDKFYALIDGNIHTINISSNKTEKIKLNYSFEKNLNDEFIQMFHENWAALAENFYDIQYHGIDWEVIKEYYEQFTPHIRNRENLRTLQRDMLGELNASHLDFRTSGDEQKTFYSIKTYETGIVFDNDNPYKVKSIVENSPVDILNNPIKPGDILTAVNDVKIDNTKNRYSYFTGTSIPDEVKLTFNQGKTLFNVKVHPISVRRFTTLLYNQWIEQKQKIVDKASQNRIAYVHMKNMGTGSLNNFLIEMTTEAYKKDALILDLRYNTGGNVHDDVLQFLSQRPYLNWKFRNGKLTQQPNFSPAAKPIVLLINEHSLSDAEMTSEGFKQLKLGKIIGTETYRWIIFTSARGLVDGSYTRLPSWGCYTLDGEDLEMTGVAPDIYVKNTFMDRLNDTDPQLEKAIEEILNDLK